MMIAVVIISFSVNQALAQSYTKSYGEFQGYKPYSANQGSNYNQAPNYNYQPYQQHPQYTYQQSVPQPQQTYNQPVAQQFKRAPRMHYQDAGHQRYQTSGWNQPQYVPKPQHYRTYRAQAAPVRRTSATMPQINPNNFRKNMLRVMLGGEPTFSKRRTNYRTTSDGSAVGRALDQRSVALSEADSAEACADRATYGSRGTRQDAAYEARSHANYARTAAEKAQQAASEGSDEAEGYAQDAWAAADRAQSAACRAESSARTNVQ